MSLRKLFSFNLREVTKNNRTVRLRFEELESRIVPDNYRWQPLGNLNWSHTYAAGTQSNWLRETEPGWVRTWLIPGDGDTAYFSGKAVNNWDCTIDTGVTVDSIIMSEGYSKDLILNNSLTTSSVSE